MPTAVKNKSRIRGLRHEQTVERRSRKPCVLHNVETATLLDWLTAYPQMRRPDRVKMWFANMHFSKAELAEAHAAGFEALANTLGYRQPLHEQSRPIIVSITPGQVTQPETLAA
jgi:hypothetical protein